MVAKLERARWRWDFLVGTHRATLACEARQPSRVLTRLGLILGGRQKNAATDIEGLLSTGLYPNAVSEIRRYAYRLEMDGQVVPFRPGHGTAGL